MRFTLSDQVISEFLSGFFAVFALVAVGCLIAIVLKKIIGNYPFIRISLVLALTPLCLVQFLGSDSSSLYLFSLIIIPLGLTIDGINYLLHQKKKAEAEQEAAEHQDKTEDPDSNVIVWEKAK